MALTTTTTPPPAARALSSISTTPSSTTNTKSAPSFLFLPAELRNIIYRLLLTHTTPIRASTCNILSTQPHPRLDLTPSLLLTSHLIHSEAAVILYTSNTFQAHPSFLLSRIFAIDPARSITSPLYISLITRYHLRVRLDCDAYYSGEELVRAFTGVEELVVEVFQSSFQACDYRALEAFEGIRGVGRARVGGSVGRLFAEWLEMCMMSLPGKEVGRAVGEEWEGERGLYEVWSHGNR